MIAWALVMTNLSEGCVTYLMHVDDEKAFGLLPSKEVLLHYRVGLYRIQHKHVPQTHNDNAVLILTIISSLFHLSFILAIIGQRNTKSNLCHLKKVVTSVLPSYTCSQYETTLLLDTLHSFIIPLESWLVVRLDHAADKP